MNDSLQTSRGLGSFMTLSRVQEINIDALCQIARQKKSSLSLKEVVDLTSLDIEEKELSDAWNRSEMLSAKYALSSGVIIERMSLEMGRERHDNDRARAERSLSAARRFASGFRGYDDLLLFSVSGSTSYRSVSAHDDLDFFCITRNDTMWVFLLKALVKRRLFQRVESSCPSLCFSYVIEDSYARELFSVPHGPLFARDSIMAIVLKGEEYYSGMLRENEWIGSYFPNLYRARLTTLSGGIENSSAWSGQSVPRRGVAHIFRKFANRILFYTLGNYIRLKSHFLNWRFARAGQRSRIFKVKISKDRCLFESNDYLELQRKYLDFKT